MQPDDVRAAFEQAEPATAEEAAAYREEALRDPATARSYLANMERIAGVDPLAALILSLFVGQAVLKLIQDRAASDDAFALDCARLLFEASDRARTVKSPPTPRGKPGKPRMA
jgi:hypothetical protein